MAGRRADAVAAESCGSAVAATAGGGDDGGGSSAATLAHIATANALQRAYDLHAYRAKLSLHARPTDDGQCDGVAQVQDRPNRGMQVVSHIRKLARRSP